MTENLVDTYLVRLRTESDPREVLKQFYRDSFETSLNKDNIIMLSSLIKLYGRYEVFFALVDVSLQGNSNIDHSKNNIGLYNYIIQKKLRGKSGKTPPLKDATDYIKNMEKVHRQVTKERNQGK